MTKLNNQRKITHPAQKNPRKSDLMTENKLKRKLYDEAELQKKKNNYHVTDNTDIRHDASDACHYCGAVFHSHAIFDRHAIRSKWKGEGATLIRK